MPRRIAFYLPRSGYLKVFGPLIDHFLEDPSRKYEPALMVPTWAIGKPEYQPDLSTLENLFQGRVRIHPLVRPLEMIERIEKEGVDAVITLAPDLAEMDKGTEAQVVNTARAKGVKWLALPHVLDELLYVAQWPEQTLNGWDAILTIGSRCVDWLEEWIRPLDAELAKRIRQKVLPAGYPELDGLARIDPVEVRNRYDFPQKKPVIFVAASCGFPGLDADGGYLDKLARKGVYERFIGIQGLRLQSRINYGLSYLKEPVILPYRNYLEALRKLADRNDALLVFKTRDKDRTSDQEAKVADRIFGDQSFYPFTTLELLSTADLYFGFQSACIFESLAAKVFSLTVLVGSNWSYTTSPADRSLTADLFLGERGLWGLPGMSRTLVGSERVTKNYLDKLAEMDLSKLKYREDESDSVLKGLICNMGRASEATVEILDAVLEGRIE